MCAYVPAGAESSIHRRDTGPGLFDRPIKAIIGFMPVAPCTKWHFFAPLLSRSDVDPREIARGIHAVCFIIISFSGGEFFNFIFCIFLYFLCVFRGFRRKSGERAQTRRRDGRQPRCRTRRSECRLFHVPCKLFSVSECRRERGSSRGRKMHANFTDVQPVGTGRGEWPPQPSTASPFDPPCPPPSSLTPSPGIHLPGQCM